MEEFKPAQFLEIKDLETLKVIADPLRAQVMEILIPEALTVNQVAERLGLSASKLYYHVNLLEKHGLVKVEDTRVIGNIIERHYRAASSSLTVDPELFSFSTDQGKENINALLSATIDATRDDLLRSLQARSFALEHGAREQPRRVIINRLVSRISDERAGEFQERLVALLKEFEDADAGDSAPEASLQTYALTVVLYPSFYFPGPGQPAPED